MKLEEYLNEKNLGSLLEYLYPNGEWIQIPYYLQPTKSVVKEFFGVNVDENLTNLKNGFNIVNDKPNRSLPASFSESGVRRFISEFNRLDIETQNQILETLYDNYAMLGLSMNVLPLSLIDILSFKITDEDKEYNKNFKLDEYRIHFRS